MIGNIGISPLTADQRIEVGTKIKRARISEGMNQKALAKELSCSNIYVSMLETGRYACDLNSLKQIAKILSVDVSELATEEILNEMRRREMEEILDEMKKKEMEEAEDKAQSILNEIMVEKEIKEGQEVDQEATAPNIEIPDFIINKVQQNNHHHVNMTDIIVAGLNYFSVLSPEAQIHHIMTFTGNKQYFNDVVNNCLAVGDFARAKQMIEILEKLK